MFPAPDAERRRRRLGVRADRGPEDEGDKARSSGRHVRVLAIVSNATVTTPPTCCRRSARVTRSPRRRRHVGDVTVVRTRWVPAGSAETRFVLRSLSAPAGLLRQLSTMRAFVIAPAAEERGREISIAEMERLRRGLALGRDARPDHPASVTRGGARHSAVRCGGASAGSLTSTLGTRDCSAE